MKEKVKIGIVGFGYIGRHHYDAIMSNKTKYSLEVIYETNILKKEKARISNKIKFFKNLNNKNIPEDLDVLVITAPTFLHTSLAETALKKVSIVIIEKPLGIVFKKAKKIINLANKQKKKVIVVKQLRMNPYYLFLKKIIDKNFLGKIHFVSSEIFLNRSEKYFSNSNWKGLKKYDGGTLLNQISHFVDLFQWLFGDLKSFYGAKIFENKKKNENSGHFSIFFKNKIFASLNYSVKCFEKNLHSKITILSDNANLEVYPDNIVLKNSSRKIKHYVNKNFKKLHLQNKKFGKGFVKFYDEVYNLINTNNYNKNHISLNNDALINFKNLFYINKKMRVFYND